MRTTDSKLECIETYESLFVSNDVQLMVETTFEQDFYNKHVRLKQRLIHVE